MSGAGEGEVVSKEVGEEERGAQGWVDRRSDLGLRSSFEPPDLERPGRLPHQQGLCEARLGYRDGSPQLGAPGPGSVHTGRHQDSVCRVFIFKDTGVLPHWHLSHGSEDLGLRSVGILEFR